MALAVDVIDRRGPSNEMCRHMDGEVFKKRLVHSVAVAIARLLLMC